MKSVRIKERELIIKLYKEKRSTYDIAKILGISQTKASFWVRRHKETGSFENLPRSGRPTPITKERLNTIREIIRLRILEPKRAGITSKEVLEIIEHKTNRKYTLRHTQRLLHKIGLSFFRQGYYTLQCVEELPLFSCLRDRILRTLVRRGGH